MRAGYRTRTDASVVVGPEDVKVANTSQLTSLSFDSEYSSNTL